MYWKSNVSASNMNSSYVQQVPLSNVYGTALGMACNLKDLYLLVCGICMYGVRADVCL